MSAHQTIEGEDLPRLDSLDKDEFRERTRHLAPGMTDEQFDQRWEEFEATKQKRGMH